MKSPQRPFVVEIKSGRRRLTRPSNSIWGNTDVRTLVLEAEAEHLSARPAQTLDVSGEPVPHDISQSSPEVIASGANSEQEIAASLTQECVCLRQSDDECAPVDVSSEQRNSKPKLARLGLRPGSKQVPSAIANEVVVSPSSQVVLGIPSDDADLSELALLDDENSRLKLLLAARLSHENQRLVMMLRRFG